ncbi:DDE-type integrase/transposase/recombinase [Trichlorobacter lovleyi]|uniref:Mu transposase C-terminal domain-containing protein n=1 Tax=Trichlorobacter lovleyi TaxID=313985 RepID=UPI00223F8EEE|nr:Mu transposase C-terminal domain-containing protein [Trichlorobacter lovleyi]QOX77911.1 DDE-type integrase/transposase/recombinase [Trichlorobacter lovleyi]
MQSKSLADRPHASCANPLTSNIIQQIRTSPPSRLVSDGRSNVTGRYPSLKMGHTIQFESHKVELAFIREYEFDDGVLEYYDQPGPIKISYRTSSGRQTTAMTTPDFFVIRSDGTAGWEECKTEQDLEQLSGKSERFVRDETGKWRCPPGEEYAAQYGLYFRVRSSGEINWIWQRNTEFLTDYLQSPNHPIEPEAETFFTALVACKQGILLSELTEHIGRYSSDDIFLLIARNKLYVDLHRHPLGEPDRVPIFTGKEHTCIHHPPAYKLTGAAITIEAGAELIWSGKLFTIVNAGEQELWLQGGDAGGLTSLHYKNFEELIKVGSIRGTEKARDTDGILELLRGKSPEIYADANRKYELIAPYLSGDAQQQASSTIYAWLEKYRDAELRYGYGYLGLLDRKSERGNRLPKLPAKTYELMETSIEEHYLNPTLTSPISVYGHYCNACKAVDVIAASFKTFVKYLKKSDATDTEQRRKGARSAYQVAIFYWELSLTTPRHGERPYEVGHIDHTELDIELVDSLTGANLGRPWLTLMMDANSRIVLAFVLSFESPSYRSCMLVMRECVRLHGRLPQTIVVDRGAEFKSVYFEQLVAFHCMTKKNRPGAKPRFGSVLERLFGITNQRFIHALLGNTQIMTNVRQVTKSVNPANLAVWTLQRLKDKLEQYFTQLYHDLDHPALGESPRNAFERGVIKHGCRSMKLIRYDDAFVLSTLPTTPKGYARVIRSRGIKLNHIYYWHGNLRLAAGMDVAVRYDPYDIGTIHAFVKGEWICCHSQYHAILQGHSEKEIELITLEIKKRFNNHNRNLAINAQKIAAFIAESKRIELELKGQRKAAEMRAAAGFVEQEKVVEPECRPLELGELEGLDVYGELTL